MAADINVVTLTGRATADPRVNDGGSTPMARIRLASTSRKKEGDDWVDAPNYFTVAVFGGLAGVVQRYVTKGTQIAVSGRLSWREWEKDGVKRESVEITAQDIRLLGGGDQTKSEDDDIQF
jgi:single-strand DNA-binding protein